MSVSVHLLIAEAFVVVAERRFKRCTRSPGRQSLSAVTGWGRQLSALAFPRLLPGLWRIVKLYALKVSVYRMILDDAVTEIAFVH